MNRIGDIEPLIQEYRSKISENESELTSKILDDYEELLQLFKQKNELVNYVWHINEHKKYQLAQETLDPLEQILYSSLLGIRTLNQEAQSESAKAYLATLKKEIERQLYELKKASISVYPICMQDLGPYGAIKSFYELLKEGNKIRLDINFKGTLKRQPHKIEIQLFRFIQYLIQIIDRLNTVALLHVSVDEKEGKVLLTFEGESLVAQLKHDSEYRLFKELINSIGDAGIFEKNECQIHLVLHGNN